MVLVYSATWCDPAAHGPSLWLPFKRRAAGRELGKGGMIKRFYSERVAWWYWSPSPRRPSLLKHCCVYRYINIYIYKARTAIKGECFILFKPNRASSDRIGTDGSTQQAGRPCSGGIYTVDRKAVLAFPRSLIPYISSHRVATYCIVCLVSWNELGGDWRRGNWIGDVFLSLLGRLILMNTAAPTPQSLSLSSSSVFPYTFCT